MEKINCKNAYYIKLGVGGEWEESSIADGKIRIGWKNQTLDDINQGNWSKIEGQIREEIENKGAAKRDFESLKTIVDSTTEDDIWLTFYSSKLWWCRVGEKEMHEDTESKYRKVKDKWRDCDRKGNSLLINEISGKISQVQGFRGTICTMKEKDALLRLLNSETSEVYNDILDLKDKLVVKVALGLKELHWKDFEILVDLIFRSAGWRRISPVGGTMKYVDMELEEPITGDKYQVQVKSKSSLEEFKNYANKFSKKDFRKLYYVVHTPEEKLAKYKHEHNDNVKLMLKNELAEMVVEYGLIDWLKEKIK